MEPLYALTGVTKFFQRGPTTVRALDGIDLEIGAGEFVALEGPSGSGKTTLLQLLGALDRPSGGDILFEGRDLVGLPDHDLANLAAEHGSTIIVATHDASLASRAPRRIGVRDGRLLETSPVV